MAAAQASPLNTLGMIKAFAGNFAPAGYVACNGQLLSIAQNQALFAVLGTHLWRRRTRPPSRFRTCAAATSSAPRADDPDRNEGRAEKCEPGERASAHPAWRPGDALRQPPAVAGDAVSDRAARVFSQRRAALRIPQHRFSVRSSAFAGTFVPSGWALCDGSILPISQNTALFSLLGTFYGGNGTTTFALPDLRNRIVIGTGNGISLGEIDGENSTTITANQLTVPQPLYSGALVTPGQFDTWLPIDLGADRRRLSDRLEARRRRRVHRVEHRRQRQLAFARLRDGRNQLRAGIARADLRLRPQR